MVNSIYPNVLVPILKEKAGWLRNNKPSSLKGLEEIVVLYLIVN